MNHPLPPSQTVAVDYYQLSHPHQAQTIEVITETLVSLYVNGAEMVTFACTPTLQRELALGFLLNEGIIESLAEVGAAYLCAAGACVDVWLHHAARAPGRHVLTSGCAGGITFDLQRALPPIESQITISIETAIAHLRTLQKAAPLHRLTGGTHTSGLFKNGQLVALAEDIGRHNTLDKLRGDCAQRGLETQDSVLVTTGRISGEMLNKAARMGCPVIVSRTTPTSLAIHMAQAWNITLIGYVRGNRATVYTGAQRIAAVVL